MYLNLTVTYKKGFHPTLIIMQPVYRRVDLVQYTTEGALHNMLLENGFEKKKPIDCQKRAKDGECVDNSSCMSTHCSKECKSEDVHELCGDWAHLGS